MAWVAQPFHTSLPKAMRPLYLCLFDNLLCFATSTVTYLCLGSMVTSKASRASLFMDKAEVARSCKSLAGVAVAIRAGLYLRMATCLLT